MNPATQSAALPSPLPPLPKSVIAKITEPFYTQHSHFPVASLYPTYLTRRIVLRSSSADERSDRVSQQGISLSHFSPPFSRLHSRPFPLPPFFPFVDPFLLFAASGARLTSLPFEKEKEQRGVLDTT